MNIPTHNYAHPEVLVSTQWLADHLHDDNLRIVEVEMSPETHAAARIPGAIFWHIPADLLTPTLSQNLDPDAIAALLARSGITPETTVIAYGSFADTGGWIFWLLKAFGHDNVRVLNGGHQKWMSEGRPVVNDFAAVEPVQYERPANTPLFTPNFRVSYSEVQAALGSADGSAGQVLIDVRTDAEYKGEHFMMKPPEGSEQAGHIPGAIHLEHLCTLNPDGTFKSFDELKALFTGQGITPDKTIFPYCAIGARSASMWFVLTYLLGYPHVRNYEGSWNEWSRQPNSPIEKIAG